MLTSLPHQEDHQAETAINRQEAAMSYREFSFKRVSDCQNADVQGAGGLSDTGRECSRLTDDYVKNNGFYGLHGCLPMEPKSV